MYEGTNEGELTTFEGKKHQTIYLVRNKFLVCFIVLVH